MASFKSYLSNNAPFLNARNEWQRISGELSDAKRRWESAKQSDANYQELLSTYKLAQNSAKSAKAVMDAAETAARKTFDKEQKQKETEKQKKKEGPIQQQIATLEAEEAKYKNAGLEFPADQQERLNDLRGQITTTPVATTETTATTGTTGTTGTDTGTTPVASYSELINTIAADEAQLKSIQEDLKKNFPSLYKGGTNGLKDWTSTQATLEAIAERRGALPKTLQGASLREFILKPTIDITTGGTGTGGPEVDIIVSSPTQAISTIQSVFRSVLNRDATADELTNFQKVLNKAERSAGRKTKKVGGRTEYTTDLDRVQFLTDEIKKIKDPITGKSEFEVKKGEKESLTSQDLMTVARANGIDLGQDQLNSYLTSIRNGKDINVVKNDIRAAAGLGRPDNIKKLLAEGTDLETIYAPYKRTMAAILELDPTSIDLNDSTLQTAIGDKELPIYEFRKLLKKDPRWQYTNNARQEVSNLALKVLQDFGFQG